MERRIAAIFAADMVGYSRLMEADEVGTLARQKRHRAELIDPEIEAHGGSIIKLTGDGMIAEFSSVVEAVQCAVSIQIEMGAREAGEPEDRRIRYRVAINLGDVIFDEGDVYGDGVNIAARLETLAEPGGVVVSGTAYDHLKSNVDVDYEDLGEQSVKNIAVPVRAYSVLLEPTSSIQTVFRKGLLRRIMADIKRSRLAATFAVVVGVGIGAAIATTPWSPRIEAASEENMAYPLPDRPSLVVLPFEDFSESKDNEYFVDGMTEDLITDLSKISGIFVISRNSSWTYKGKPVKSQQVAEELGVRYIVEGSARRAGNQIRVNAQLIDAIGGHHIWADRYDSRVEDVFSLQDKVLHEITSALAVQLTDTEEIGIGGEETASSIAYDAVLNGLALLRQDSQDNVVGAMAAFEKAIEIDPDYHRAYAGLAAAHWRVAQSFWMMTMGSGYEKAWKGALENIEKASKSPSALSYSVLAEMLAAQGKHSEAFDELDKALALAPNDPHIHLAKARVLNATGRAAEAEAAVRFALRHDPLQPTGYLRELGVALLHQKKYEETAATMRRVLQRDTDVVADIQTLVSALGHLGRAEEVPDLIRRYDEIAVPSYFDPFTADESVLWWYGDMFSYDPDYRQHLYDGLIKAGVPSAAGTDLDHNRVRDQISQIDGVFFVRDVPRITTGEAHRLWQAKDAVFVDVRAVLDYDAGHIPGSVNQSLLVELSRQALLEIASPDDILVFSCHGPHCPYSAYGAAKAKLWGFPNTRYFPGGFPAWEEAGLPIEATE
ncbi:MAG: tetratricopeptide repeat protein [Leisingera sp.]